MWCLLYRSVFRRELKGLGFAHYWDLPGGPTSEGLLLMCMPSLWKVEETVHLRFFFSINLAGCLFRVREGGAAWSGLFFHYKSRGCLMVSPFAARVLQQESEYDLVVLDEITVMRRMLTSVCVLTAQSKSVLDTGFYGVVKKMRALCQEARACRGWFFSRGSRCLF